LFIINPKTNIKTILIKQSFTKISFKKLIKHTFVLLALLFSLSYLISLVAFLFNISDLHFVSNHILTIPFSLLVYYFLVRVFLEEWFFRSFLVNNFGVLISSILFSIVHAGYSSVIEVAGAFCLGFVLAIYFKKINNIWPLFFAHSIYNFLIYFILIYT
jgi:uncharacterized protein